LAGDPRWGEGDGAESYHGEGIRGRPRAEVGRATWRRRSWDWRITGGLKGDGEARDMENIIGDEYKKGR
jgi:hypothetical protein